uniref:Phage tail tape measure protein n=1 Tax=Streptomyces sp. NBC_00003 TaxID=2903608 RepID=A0AAU2V7Y0_9ACTN
MSGYSLTVQLRAEVNGLISGLRSASDAARSFATQTAAAERRIAALDAAAARATRQINSLAGRASTASTHLNSLGGNANTARTHLTRAGDEGDRSMRGLERTLANVRSRGASLAGLLSGGALLMGTADVVEEGNRYQREMSQFQAVTGATAGQMQRAGWMANKLGADLSLPTVTAADAAGAMVELAKAGFRTDQSITAVRAALVLSSAAGVSAADSAKYLGDIMDQFGLGADQAGRAADVLAATANNASGGILDIYYAMRYAGPVAAGLGVSMEDAASAIGMMGKAGIIGSTAGTALRGMLANLAAPTKDMVTGLKAMGIEAWSTEGRFLGIRNVIDGLSKAQHNMSQQDFAAAVKKAFGKPAMAGAMAIAHQGVASFDALSLAVRESGAAADITAARGKGLAGAMTQLKTQARQTGLALYEGMAPGLEYVARLTTRGLAGATPYLTAALKYGRDLATLYGPELKSKTRQGLGDLAEEAKRFLKPLKDIGEDGLASGLNLLINAWDTLGTVIENVGDGLEPVAKGMGFLHEESGGAANTLDILVLAANGVMSAVAGLSSALVPIGHVVGSLVQLFGALPGPVQTAVAAMLLTRRVGPAISGLASTVGGRLTGAWQSVGQQMRVQQTLAAASGQSIGRMSAAYAVLQTRIPIVGQMSAAFRSAQGPTSTFASTLNGAARAAGTGLMGAMRGLMGVMGGPWGVALMGITVGLGLLASSQQRAAERAAEHEQRIANLTQALRDSKGLIDSNVRAQAAQILMDTKIADGKQRLVDVMKGAGISLSQLTDAYLGQGTSLDALKKQLDDVARAHGDVWQTNEFGDTWQGYDVLGRRAADASDALGKVKGEMSESVERAKELAAAEQSSGAGATAYDRLKTAVGALADKTSDADTRTRALKSALDLLSGGSISLQAAEARVNSAILDVNSALKSGIDHADGFGDALLSNTGALNTTTRNGQQLYNQLTALSDAAADASVSAYALAQQNGKELPDSLAAAREQMQKARDAAIDAARGYGLTKEQAQGVADSLGLLPSKVSLLLETKGMDSTLSNLLAVDAEFDRLKTQKTIKVDSLTEQAQKDLKSLGFSVETIPGTREIKITAPSEGARSSLKVLLDQLGTVPNGKNVTVTAETAATIASLQAVQTAIYATPGSKTVTVYAPTEAARTALLGLGFTISSIPGSKDVTVTVPTGGAVSAASSIQGAIDSVHGKTVTIGVSYSYSPYVNVGPPPPKNPYMNADGNLYPAPGRLLAFADGGMREDHVAQIARGGDLRIWAEPETEGESYIPHARSKRPRSRRIAEETVRRLGGDPSGIQWYANGGVSAFSYTPASLFTLSSLATSSQNKDGKFDLSIFTKKLRDSSNVANRWRNELATIASRAGTDVAKALEAMGEDGVELVHKMATGSSKYLKQMAGELRDLAASAKASLSDFTRQLGTANVENADFQKNLVKLAGMGYGDLAAQLNAQNDEAAHDLAAEAVADKGKAGRANEQAKTSAAQLTSDETGEVVQIIAAITSDKVGIHQVADTTGLGEDEIIRVIAKAGGQVRSALGSRGTKFLADLTRAQQGLSYADGGIREGIYATSGGLIRFAEPSTHGEAYVPLAVSKRQRATAVLSDVADRFGYALMTGVQDANAGRVQVVVIQQAAPLIGTQTIQIDRPGATEQQIASAIGYQVRRAQRGGVRR